MHEQTCDEPAPLLSVVVAIVSDTTQARADASHLIGSLEALQQQIDPPPLEIIVPHQAGVEGIAAASRRFPTVRFLQIDDVSRPSGQVGSREHHDALRARGLQAARGKLIALLEDHGRPDPRWSAQIAEAHQARYAAVGGAIENGIDRPLNWAVYFCDFGRYQSPVPRGRSACASDANVSYKRSALEAIGSVWQEVFHETAVNGALLARGEQLVLSPDIVVYQHRAGLRLQACLEERFVWGRSYAASRGALLGTGKRLVYAALAPALPAILLLRLALTTTKRRRLVRPFIRALPLTTLLTASWSCGELVGYATARSGPASVVGSRSGAPSAGR
jgi:hypothetical protein